VARNIFNHEDNSICTHFVRISDGMLRQQDVAVGQWQCADRHGGRDGGDHRVLANGEGSGESIGQAIGLVPVAWGRLRYEFRPGSLPG